MLPFGVGLAVGLTVALCVAVLIVLAVLRWRRAAAVAGATAVAGAGRRAAAGGRTELQLQEMEWDNSTFNITVNPLDHEAAYDEEIEFDGGLPPPAADDDEFACSCDEIDVENEAVGVVIKPGPGCKELEWDDSTLSY
jgi:hypothetical protein